MFRKSRSGIGFANISILVSKRQFFLCFCIGTSRNTLARTIMIASANDVGQKLQRFRQESDFWLYLYSESSSSHECILLPSCIYNMHQDTKSARLMAVSKRSSRRTNMHNFAHRVLSRLTTTPPRSLRKKPGSCWSRDCTDTTNLNGGGVNFSPWPERS